MSLKGWKFKAAVITGGVVLLTVLFLVSPFFHIDEIIVEGNDRVVTSEILSRLELGGTTNILFFDADAAAVRVMGNLHVGDVSFRRSIPGRLYVTVQERRPSAYVEHGGRLLVLDDTGLVLEIRNQFREALPLLEGLQFTRVQLGEVLEVTNETDFITVVLYTQLLTAHDLIHRITHINVADPQNIRILVDYTEFHVGGTSDADQKVRTIAAILDIMPDANIRRGFVSLQTIRPYFFFELLQ